jgi:hypothetical protein
VGAALQQLGEWSLVTCSLDGTSVVAGDASDREQAVVAQTLAEAAQDPIGGLCGMLPAEESAWRYPAVMQEFVTQGIALAGHLDTFPGLLGGPAEQELLSLLAGTSTTSPTSPALSRCLGGLWDLSAH